MALKDDIKKQRADAQAKSGKSISLLDALSNAVTVFKDGLIAPNRFNAPAANRFKDSALGLIGAVPGLGVPAAAVQTADYTKRDEPVAAMLSALGAAIPALGAMMKVAAPAPSAIKNKESGAIFGIADEILGEYPVQKGIHTALRKKAAAVGGDVTHPSVVIPDPDNGVSYFLAGDGSLRVNVPNTFDSKSKQLPDDYMDVLVDIGLMDADTAFKNTPRYALSLTPGSYTEVVKNYLHGLSQSKYRQNIIVSATDADKASIPHSSILDHEMSHALSNLFGGVRGGNPKTFTDDIVLTADPADKELLKKVSIGLNSVTDEMTAATFASREGLMPYLNELLNKSFNGHWKEVDGNKVWSSEQVAPRAFNKAVTAMLDNSEVRKNASPGLNKLYDLHKDSYDIYSRLAGEVEARSGQELMVQQANLRKLNITSKEASNRLAIEVNPHAYMDTPLEDVIMQYTSPLIKQVNP